MHENVEPPIGGGTILNFFIMVERLKWIRRRHY
jgi:hypothetical protein